MKLRAVIMATLIGTGLLTAGSAGQATAAPVTIVNFSPCKDRQNMGWSGLPCTVADGDFDLAPPAKNDSEQNVETVLEYVFGSFVELNLMAGGVTGDQSGFNFSPNSFGGAASSISVLLDQTYDFMTFKAGSIWGIADIRGLTDFTFTTDDLIENSSGVPLNFSHLSFWNDPPALRTGREVPEPMTVGLLGVGLAGIGLLRRRKR